VVEAAVSSQPAGVAVVEEGEVLAVAVVAMPEAAAEVRCCQQVAGVGRVEVALQRHKHMTHNTREFVMMVDGVVKHKGCLLDKLLMHSSKACR
jgi:hypothetical protein